MGKTNQSAKTYLEKNFESFPERILAAVFQIAIIEVFSAGSDVISVADFMALRSPSFPCRSLFFTLLTRPISYTIFTVDMNALVRHAVKALSVTTSAQNTEYCYFKILHTDRDIFDGAALIPVTARELPAKLGIPEVARSCHTLCRIITACTNPKVDAGEHRSLRYRKGRAVYVLARGPAPDPFGRDQRSGDSRRRAAHGYVISVAAHGDDTRHLVCFPLHALVDGPQARLASRQ